MLNYYTFGSGSTVIWLHGLLGNCLNLSSVARSVQGKNYMLDARNHGNSFHARGMDYITQANDVINLMNTLDVPKASIIGHSMGGKTAMTLALLQPERVEKLCIMDIAPIDYKESLKSYYIKIQKYLNFMKFENIQGKTRKEIEALCQTHFND